MLVGHVVVRQISPRYVIYLLQSEEIHSLESKLRTLKKLLPLLAEW